MTMARKTPLGVTMVQGNVPTLRLQISIMTLEVEGTHLVNVRGICCVITNC